MTLAVNVTWKEIDRVKLVCYSEMASLLCKNSKFEQITMETEIHFRIHVLSTIIDVSASACKFKV